MHYANVWAIRKFIVPRLRHSFASKNAEARIQRSTINYLVAFYKSRASLGFDAKDRPEVIDHQNIHVRPRTTAGTIQAISRARDNRTFKGTEDATNWFRQMSIFFLCIEMSLKSLFRIFLISKHPRGWKIEFNSLKKK